MISGGKISNYWWCQIAGWGIVGLSFLFYANFVKEEIDPEYLLKTTFIVFGGFASTHLLRWFMKKYDWLLLPVEKTIFRLAIAIVVTCLVYSALVLLLYQVAGLNDNRRNLDFMTRLFANSINWMFFIVPWVLFYYFYHYLVKSRKQQFDTLKLEALVRELELKTIKAHINPHFIFNALNSIRALIDEDPARARESVTHLSNILNDEKYRYLFSVEAVNELVNKGIPFREAYKTIGDQIEKGEFRYDFSKGLNHTHEGSIGNLKNGAIIEEMNKVLQKF